MTAKGKAWRRSNPRDVLKKLIAENPKAGKRKLLALFMEHVNGRTGRALWAWQMHHTGRDPFALPFLHRFYYQTLENTEDGMMITDLIERLRRHYEICAAIDLPLIISPPS